MFIKITLENDRRSQKMLVRLEDIENLTACLNLPGCILRLSGRDIHVFDEFDELSEIIMQAERCVLRAERYGLEFVRD